MMATIRNVEERQAVSGNDENVEERQAVSGNDENVKERQAVSGNDQKRGGVKGWEGGTSRSWHGTCVLFHGRKP